MALLLTHRLLYRFVEPPSHAPPPHPLCSLQTSSSVSELKRHVCESVLLPLSHFLPSSCITFLFGDGITVCVCLLAPFLDC